MQTPTQQVVAAAQAASEVSDSQGRTLALRRLSALDRLRLFKAAGAALAANAGWMGMATLAASVTAIDDVPVPSPSTEGQLEALVARLGDAGLAAVAAALAQAPATPAADAKN